MERLPTDSAAASTLAASRGNRPKDTGRRLPKTSLSPGNGVKKASKEQVSENGDGGQRQSRRRRPRPKKAQNGVPDGANGVQATPAPSHNGVMATPSNVEHPQQTLSREQQQQRSNLLFGLRPQAAELASMEFSAHSEREQALAWYNADGPLSDGGGTAESIGRQVRNLWENTRPTFARLSARSRILADIKACLDRRWPGCGLEVVPFGSSLTGLLEATSDLDLCLIDPTRPHGVGTPASEVLPLPQGARCQTLNNPGVVGMAGVPDYYSVKLIARALEQPGNYNFREVNPIWHAAVPIVKFVHGPTNIACDVNVNDTFGLRNSYMIKAYIDLAPDFVGPLLFCIKKWASRRDLNDPSGAHGPASMNSYSICLFALQFLQLRGVLPNLQSKALLEALKVPPSHVWQRPKAPPRRRKAAASNVPMPIPTQSSNGTTESANTDESTVAASDAMLTDDATQQDEESTSTSTTIFSDPELRSRRFDTSFVTLVTENDRQTAEKVALQHQCGQGQAYVADWMRTASRAEKDVALGQLLCGFFQWFAAMDFDRCGISLREGHPVRRMEVLGPEDADLATYPSVPLWEPRWEQHPILCQDPFILDRNTCTGIMPKVRTTFLQEVRRSVSILSPTTAVQDAGASSSSVLYDLLTDERCSKLQAKHQRSMSMLTEQEKQQLTAEAAAMALNVGRGNGRTHHLPPKQQANGTNTQARWRGTSRMPAKAQSEAAGGTTWRSGGGPSEQH